MQDTFLPASTRRAAHPWWLLAYALPVVALTLFAYRALPTRPFAADDFQWLIGARTLSFGAMLRQAFDPGQNHFYRPLVWLLFWLQARVFGLDPRGYHAVSLGLHLANALLLGGLVWRLTNDNRAFFRRSSFVVGLLSFVIPFTFVAIHPAPFEAVAWVSAQSELLAAFWLLLALHMWLSGWWTMDGGRYLLSAPSTVRRLLSTVCLALALLTKESAVIGLPLVILLDFAVADRGQGTGDMGKETGDRGQARLFRFIVPVLLTLAYLALQLRVERQNYVVDQGGYGFGPQLITNPLRSLALIVLPLPGSEHADAAWLVPVGAVVAFVLVVWLILDCMQMVEYRFVLPIRNLQFATPIVALACTLLPTAPFVSPPDSRYLYLPVMAFAGVGAALCGWLAGRWRRGEGEKGRQSISSFLLHPSSFIILAVAVLTIYATHETAAREERFAIATGADGSLLGVATDACAAHTLDRLILLNAPMAEQHARALLRLACGKKVTPIFVDTMAIAEANLEANSLIIDFPNGSAHIARQT